MTRRGTLWFGWSLATLAMLGFACLGFWQYGRMQEKQALLDDVAAAMQGKRAFPLASDIVPFIPAWVEGEGRIAPHTFLLDNQMREGRAGVRVLCLLDLGRGWGRGARLVDFGWVAMPGDRSTPDAACPAGPMRVRGLLVAPPSSGLAVGGAPMQKIARNTWLMTRVDFDAIHAATRQAPWPYLVRLDPALPVGYPRDLDVLPNTLPPERHLGYAVQWWALALAVLATALVLTFRNAFRKHRPSGGARP